MCRLAALLALAAALTGCNPECVDRLDCKKYETGPDGAFSATFTCAANKCVQGNPGGGPAPTDGGQ